MLLIKHCSTESPLVVGKFRIINKKRFQKPNFRNILVMTRGESIATWIGNISHLLNYHYNMPFLVLFKSKGGMGIDTAPSPPMIRPWLGPYCRHIDCAYIYLNETEIGEAFTTIFNKVGPYSLRFIFRAFEV